MRIVFALAALAACAPDIAPGTYLCGPEQLCPDGLACNGPDNICVSPAFARPFACGAKNEDVAGDDTPATAQDLGELACISLVREKRSCMPPGDASDYYKFTVAEGCTNVRVQASVVYPIAFERLVLQLARVGEMPQTIDTACGTPRLPSDADARSCLTAPVTPGTYVLGVVPDGTDNCDGACAFNRYGLAVQVSGN
ncbi:MAG TPA: hypothetical protein VK427_17990 [Kofleriaceae bacterium]|nr:hypothetical protein [Kofleriaceae bacterium]